MYANLQQQVTLAKAAALDSAADPSGANFAPGYTPVMIRAIGVVITVAPSAAGVGVLKFDKRPTAGSDASRGDGDVGIINIPTGPVTVGKVYYDHQINVSLAPGQQVVAQVTDAIGTGGKGDIFIVYDEDPEHPANISAMVLTT